MSTENRQESVEKAPSSGPKLKQNISNFRKRIAPLASWNVFSDYSQRSTIHGVRYLGEENRHWSERFSWLIIFVTSIALSGILIYQIYSRWLNAPAIISFSNEATPISEIPFPTITICSDMKVPQSVLNYSHISDKLSRMDFDNFTLSEKQVQQMHALSSFCDSPFHLDTYIKSKNISIDRNIQPYIEELVPNLFHEEQFATCHLNSETPVACYEIFSKTLTDSGRCYTFNHLDSAQVYYENKLADDFPRLKPFRSTTKIKDPLDDDKLLSYPYRMMNAGVGFKLVMAITKIDDTIIGCRHTMSLGSGLKIHIHSADESPRMKEHFHHVPFNHEVRFTVRPNIIKTDASLIENYKIEQRKCIAENEHDLVFFKKYSQSNCRQDALVLQTIDTCGCAMFYMPRFNDTKVCGFSNDFNCVENVQESVKNLNLKHSCLPACDGVTYDTEISMSKIDAEYLEEMKEIGDKWIYLTISLTSEQYFSLRRSELYTRNDFIAGCGGILGLFMGVSILSIVEVLYSLTIRAFFDWRNQKSKKQVEKEIENVDNATIA